MMFTSLRSKIKAMTAFVSLAMVSLTMPTAYAASPSYQYSYWGDTVAAPAPYYATQLWDGSGSEAGNLLEPRDLFVTSDRLIYVLDSGNRRIVVLDEHLQLLRTIQDFTNEGRQDQFADPQGIFVTDDKQIYVADTGNNRIVHLDDTGNVVKIIDNPQSELLLSTFVFQPAKVVVDHAGRVYTLSIGVFDGFMEFNSDGTFSSFYGANRVQVDPIEYVWKLLSTEEQRSRMVQFTPTEFTNLDIDADGFIYATSGDESGEPIKKLNAQGVDILRREGPESPIGDLRYYVDDGPSRLIDIDVTHNEIYSVLDSKRGRIFTYNGDGYLLYVFGGLGNRVGEFRTPRAIERVGDKFLVLDQALGEITVFEPTEYGRTLNDAVQAYDEGNEELAASLFQKAVSLNANLEYAYNGIGKAKLREGQYAEALMYFAESMDRKYYSKAFLLYRKEVLRSYFPSIMTSIVVIWLGWYVWKIYKKRRDRKKVAL